MALTRDDLLGLLSSDQIQAFLRVIRQGESSQDESAYTIIFGGEHFDAPPWEHPNRKVTKGSLTSTAAGAYQFLAGTWKEIAETWGLPDFSPHSQDLGSVALLYRCRAIDPILKGDLDEAIRRANKTWASLPGSPYGQPVQTLKDCREVFAAYGGRESGDSPVSVAPDPGAPKPTEVKRMAPLIPVLIESLVPLIPQLGKLFGSGSEVSNRNNAALQVVADGVVKATQAVNLQDAVEKVQSDPDALSAAKQAVSDALFTIGEAGGGGIDGARKFNATGGGSDGYLALYKRGDFWFSLLLFIVPLILVLDVVWFHPELWGDNPRIQVLTAGLNLLSFIGGYWLGSTIQSARKTELLAAK